jgi:hypothetical protein
MKVVRLAVLLSWMVGCAPSTHPVPPVAPAEAPVEELEGFVVVAPGARFRLGPGSGDPFVLTTRAGDEPRLRALRGGYDVYRVVADHGELVEIESTGESNFGAAHPHCAMLPSELDSLSVRFFVRRSDLAQVLTKPVTLAYPDGTSVRLQSGLVLFHDERAPDRFIIDSGNFVLPIAGAALRGHVGSSYRVEPRFPTPETPDLVVPQAFASREVTVGGQVLGARFPGMVSNVFGRRPAGARELVTMRSPCAEIVASIPSERIQSRESIGGGLRLESSHAYRGPHVRKGAALLDPRGRRIGVATDQAGFDAETRGSGDMRCFTRTLVTLYGKQGRLPTLPDEILTVCASRADVVETPERAL